MSNKVQHYSLYEGTFLTTAPVLDRSVNILMFRDPDNQEYNVIINRATLDEEQTPEAFCESQMDILRNQLPGFQLEGKLLRHETGPSKLPVVQIANRYLQEGKTIRQVQTIIQLPYHIVTNPTRREVLIFTLYSETDFTEFQRKHYVQIINSVNPNASALAQ
ncbi:DcrB-related protein [Cronobacter dublinensis]|nr:DcrB-related protein [Cronobacter dublinensis]